MNGPGELHLGKFEPVSLSDMDGVELINRIDTKFVFTTALLPSLINELSSVYRILDINQKRVHAYDTHYFDDERFSLYLNHHNQHGNRFKLRLRKYGSSNAVYMEVKKKTNKGRTIKSRKKTEFYQSILSAEQEQFFHSESGSGRGDWQFSLNIQFDRITLVSFNPPERVTIDIDLQFSDQKQHKKFDSVVIAEVKQGSKSPSVFIQKMKELQIQPFSISKYCLGVSFLKNDIKRNLFKQQQREFLQIQNLS